MKGPKTVIELLATDPRDVDCDVVFAALDRYVECVLRAADAESRYPGIAVHLRSCSPCLEDFIGLLAAAERESASL